MFAGRGVRSLCTQIGLNGSNNTLPPLRICPINGHSSAIADKLIICSCRGLST
jgi:hypothetical protein